MARGSLRVAMSGGPVVPLGRTPPERPPPPRRAIGRLAGAAMSLMVTSALMGLLSGIAYLTVNWSGTARSVMVVTIVAAVLLFFVSGAASILLAARRTYRDPGSRRDVAGGP